MQKLEWNRKGAGFVSDCGTYRIQDLVIGRNPSNWVLYAMPTKDFPYEAVLVNEGTTSKWEILDIAQEIADFNNTANINQ